jgi:hypothetical protein
VLRRNSYDGIMFCSLTITRWTSLLFFAPAAIWGQQYKADRAGAFPAAVSSDIAQAMDKTGFQISNNGVAYCEIWLRTALPFGPISNEQNVTLPNFTVGALLGVIRFDGDGTDRRGQTIRAGVYTLRYGIMPMNDTHQGAAPQRDFLLVIPASEDRDLKAAPNLDTLAAMSRKASQTPHPAVLSFWKAASDAPGFSQQGDSDWVLQAKVGDTPVAIIVAGSAGS